MKSKCKIDSNGTKRWCNYKNELHRENGPAYESANGHKAWYFHGKRHRTDGPAIVHVNGDKEWWLNDKLHREDGPAVIRINGYKEYWFDGIKQKMSKKKIKENIIVKTKDILLPIIYKRYIELD